MNMYKIPDNYGDNKAVLMVRDPWTVYSYWEITPQRSEELIKSIYNEGKEIDKKMLRVINKTSSNYQVFGDYEIMDWVTSWYIHTPDPGNKWQVEVGYITKCGKFFTGVSSNVVETPVNSMSEMTDHEWMCTEDEYYKMFAISGGVDEGKSSVDVKEFVKRHLKNWLSSEGMTSWQKGT